MKEAVPPLTFLALVSRLPPQSLLIFLQTAPTAPQSPAVFFE